MDTTQETINQETTSKPSGFSRVIRALGKFLKVLWEKYLWPAIRDGMYTSVVKTSECVFYHRDISTMPNSNERKPFDNSNPQPRPSDRPVGRRCWKEREPNRFGVAQVCAGDRNTLDTILEKMRDRIASQSSGGCVSVGEMYGYANLMTNSMDYNDGWTSVSEFSVRFEPASNCYVLYTPETIRL